MVLLLVKPLPIDKVIETSPDPSTSPLPVAKPVNARFREYPHEFVVILVEPLKEVPLIVLEFCSVVAVEELPVKAAVIVSVPSGGGF